MHDAGHINAYIIFFIWSNKAGIFKLRLSIKIILRCKITKLNACPVCNLTPAFYTFKTKIDLWQKLPNKENVAKELLKLNKKSTVEFFKSLTQSATRFIEQVIILSLHGLQSTVNSITEAIDYLNNYSENKPKLPLVKYEIILKYNTGDKIDAIFKEKKDAIEFLKAYL
jgi:hypothetical protein